MTRRSPRSRRRSSFSSARKATHSSPKPPVVWPSVSASTSHGRPGRIFRISTIPRNSRRPSSRSFGASVRELIDAGGHEGASHVRCREASTDSHEKMNGRGEQRNRRAAHSEYCVRLPAVVGRRGSSSAALREEEARAAVDRHSRSVSAARKQQHSGLLAPLVPAMDNGISPRSERLGPPRDSVRNMSQQNVAVARRWVELFNRRDDVDEFLSLHDSEVVLQTPGGPRLRGHDQVRDWFEAGYENVRPRILPERFVAGGDTVVGLGEPNFGGSNRVKSLTRARARGPTGFATARSSHGSPLRLMPPPLKRRDCGSKSPTRSREPLRTT